MAEDGVVMSVVTNWRKGTKRRNRRWTNLQGQLPTVQDGSLEGVLLDLQLCLGSLSRCEQILEDDREQTLSALGRDEEVWKRRVGVSVVELEEISAI